MVDPLELQGQEDFYDTINRIEKQDRAKSEKQRLKDTIEYMSEEQCEFINKLTNFGSFPNKKQLLELSGYDTSKTYDTATPQPYMDKLRELYPNAINGCWIYDYSKNAFGELVNINDLLSRRLQELFK